MKLAYILFFICINSWVLANNTNSDLNDAIRNHDYNLVVSIIENNTFTIQEKMVHFRIAKEICVKKRNADFNIKSIQENHSLFEDFYPYLATVSFINFVISIIGDLRKNRNLCNIKSVATFLSCIFYIEPSIYIIMTSNYLKNL